jgi:hypothetical protein
LTPITNRSRIPRNKLIELRKEAYESLLQIMEQQKTDSNKRDFGEIIFEYNRYLQEFREYLMKFNNEGIPEIIFQDGNEKTLKIVSINNKDADKIVIGEYEISKDLLELTKFKLSLLNSIGAYSMFYFYAPLQSVGILSSATFILAT